MSRQEFSDPDLSLILEISGNNQCFDCLSKNPRFCSVNNGVLLCGICARAHQYYNNNVSRIKSLEADLWSKEEVKYLRLGGNTRLKNLFVEYDIPNDLDNQDYKYHTKIAEYYRTLLGQETRNRLCLLKRPNFSEGKETIEKVPNNQNDLNNNNNIKNNLNEKIDFNNNIINNDDEGYLFGLKKNNNKNNENKQSDSSINFNKMIDSIGSFFNRVGEKINEKSKEYDINGKINNIKNSDTYKSISEKFDQGINIIQQKTNELISDINNTNEYEFYAQQEINNQLDSQPNFQSNYSNISSQSYYNKNINNNNQNQFNSNLNNNNNNMNNINNNMNNFNNNNMNNINNNMNNLNNNNINNNVANPIKKSFDKNIKDNIIENNINNNYNNINENINDINALNINENDSINKKEENNNFDINQKNEEKLD